MEHNNTDYKLLQEDQNYGYDPSAPVTPNSNSYPPAQMHHQVVSPFLTDIPVDHSEDRNSNCKAY